MADKKVNTKESTTSTGSKKTKATPKKKIAKKENQFFNSTRLITILGIILLFLLGMFAFNKCSDDQAREEEKKVCIEDILLEQAKCCDANSDSIKVHRTEIDNIKAKVNSVGEKGDETRRILNRHLAKSSAPVYRPRHKTIYDTVRVEVPVPQQMQNSSNTVINQNEINRQTKYNNTVNKRKVVRGGYSGGDDEEEEEEEDEEEEE